MQRPSRLAKIAGREQAMATADSDNQGLDDDIEDFHPFKSRKRRGRPVDLLPRPKPAKVVQALPRRPRIVYVANEEELTDDSLFNQIRCCKSPIVSIVDEWIDIYKQRGRDTGLLDLIQFIIRSSGCRARITTEMYEKLDHVDIIRKLTEEFDEDTGDYPLIQPGSMWKRFKSNFCDFMQTLVRQCQFSIIYDQYMIDNIISLLTALSDSHVRAFRHTSSLAAMKLMTSLVEVALSLSNSLDHTLLQYEHEKNKPEDKQAPELLETLNAKKTEALENIEELRSMMTYIFKAVFVHRYRDIQPEIRSICITEIGVWMKIYPGIFLDDSYLKYIGWTLYDKIGDVRICCVKSLQPLYLSEELAPKLELFTKRFKIRLTEMTLDRDYDVAVHAIKLITLILRRYQDNVLTDRDCEGIYQLVYSTNRSIAQAAGEFLNIKLFISDEDVPLKPQSFHNKKPLTDLVQFFIESELHEHGAYLVDALWDQNEMLKDWKCMTEILLNTDYMDDIHETSLIEVMTCCVRQAATGEFPISRSTNRKLMSREQKQILQDRSQLTEHFIVVLPELLSKYSVDACKITNLLQIIVHFDIEIYTSSRQEKQFKILLCQLSDLVDKHTDSELLENCSKAWEHVTSPVYPVQGIGGVAKSTLVDKLVDAYKIAFQNFFQEGDEPDENDTFALLVSLKRIYAFYMSHDLNAWNLWDSLFSIVHAGYESCNIPEQIIKFSIACCNMSILWFLESISSEVPADIEALRANLNVFIPTCYNLLMHEQESIQEEAYTTLCDLFIYFSSYLSVSCPKKADLIILPNENCENMLAKFLKERVFVHTDTYEDNEEGENQRIKDLHKRRRYLASYVNLILYNVLKIKHAAPIFKQYLQFYNDYGDIIKSTLGRCKDIDRVLTSETLVVSLTQIYGDLLDKFPKFLDSQCSEFSEMKDLSRRYSLSFGLDQSKIRDSVASIHKGGILFAFKDKDDSSKFANLLFLEIISEFSNKLIKQDKEAVLNFLNKQITNHDGVNDCPYWSSVHYYKASLECSESMRAPFSTPSRGRGRPAGSLNKQTRRSAQAEGDEWVIEKPVLNDNPTTVTLNIKRRRIDTDTSRSDSMTTETSEQR